MIDRSRSVRKARSPSNSSGGDAHHEGYQAGAEIVAGEAHNQNDDSNEQKSYRAILAPCVAPCSVGDLKRVWLRFCRRFVGVE